MASGNESGHNHPNYRAHGVNSSTSSRFNSATDLDIGSDEDDQLLVAKVQPAPSYPSSSEFTREGPSHLSGSLLDVSNAFSSHTQRARTVDSGDKFLFRLEEPDDGYAFPGLPPQVPDLTNESLEFGVSLSRPPLVQGMERSEGYDPYRIPASVFESSKAGTPMEWSVASNESLFSIHVGNSSFSKDQFFNILGGDLHKSGEFFTLGQPPLSTSPPSPAQTPLNLMDMETEVHNEYEDLGEGKMIDDSFQGNFMETLGKQKEEKAPSRPIILNSSSISGLSDGSGESAGSTRSFAFQVLAQPEHTRSPLKTEKAHSRLKPQNPPESEPIPELEAKPEPEPEPKPQQLLQPQPQRVVQQTEKIELPANFFKKDKWCACSWSFSWCSWPRCYSGGCCK